MSEPFLAEIRIVGFNFAPRGWAFCDGQILPIDQNQSLYSLLGTTYGGDGRTSFALPDLRGRVPVHFGAGISLGQKGGEERVALDLTQIPSHSHALRGVADSADSANPAGNLLAGAGAEVYETPGDLSAMASASIGNTGGQEHENMQPFRVMHYVIAITGLFPSRN